MTKIKDRITNIADYFCGMEIKNGYYLLQIKYGRRWGAYNSKDDRIKAAHSEEEEDVWFYYGDVDEVELDEIFDLIDETIQMNKSALAKVQLLKEKIEELKSLFEELPLTTLNTLEFKFSAPKKTKPRKSTKKKKEAVTEAKNDQIESSATTNTEEVISND